MATVKSRSTGSPALPRRRYVVLDMALQLQFLVSPLLHAHQFFVLLSPLDSFNLTMYIGSSLVWSGVGASTSHHILEFTLFGIPGAPWGNRRVVSRSEGMPHPPWPTHSRHRTAPNHASKRKATRLCPIPFAWFGPRSTVAPAKFPPSQRPARRPRTYNRPMCLEAVVTTRRPARPSSLRARAQELHPCAAPAVDSPSCNTRLRESP